MQSNGSSPQLFDNTPLCVPQVFNNQTFENCTPVFAPQHSWEFGGCKFTKTSSLPILPSSSWDKISFPTHNVSNDVHSSRESVVQQLLESWDPRIDEFFKQYQHHLQIRPNE